MTLKASKRIRRSIASTIFVLAMSAVSASASPILSIGPATTTANVGEIVELNIDIASVTDLFTFSLELLFDPTKLSFLGSSEGSFAPGDFFVEGAVAPERSNVASGIGNLFIFLASGDGTLASARFEVLMAGTSWITLQDPVFTDFDLNPMDISFDTNTTGSAEVIGVASTVPDHASTMVLLVSALAAIACLHTRILV